MASHLHSQIFWIMINPFNAIRKLLLPLCLNRTISKLWCFWWYIQNYPSNVIKFSVNVGVNPLIKYQIWDKTLEWTCCLSLSSKSHTVSCPVCRSHRCFHSTATFKTCMKYSFPILQQVEMVAMVFSMVSPFRYLAAGESI